MHQMIIFRSSLVSLCFMIFLKVQTILYYSSDGKLPLSFEDYYPVIAIIAVLIGVFWIGVAVGKHWEKGTQERKQLKDEINKLQNQFSDKIKADPGLASWIKDNMPQLVKLFKLNEGDKS